MKKAPLILGIAYAVYGLLILALVAVQFISVIMVIANNAGPEAIPASGLIPLATFGVIALITAAATFILAYLLIAKRNQLACLVLAGIMCIGIPFGTILGIATIILLARPSVKAQFARRMDGDGALAPKVPLPK